MTITDKQIHALRARASGNTPNHINPALVDLCDEALGWVDGNGRGDPEAARTKLAAIVNAAGQ